MRRPTDELLMKLAGVLLGIVVFAGLLSLHAVYFIPAPTPPGFPPPTTDPATVAYRNAIRILAITSMSLLDFAAGFVVTLAWIAGFSKGEISESSRRGIWIFATVFIAIWLIFSSSVLSIFLALFL